MNAGDRVAHGFHVHEDLRVVLAAIDEIVVIAAGDGRVLQLSAAAQARFGEPPPGAHLADLFDPEAGEVLARALQALQSGTSAGERLELVVRGAPPMVLGLHLRPFTLHGEACVIGSGRALPDAPPRLRRSFLSPALKFEGLFATSLFGMAITDGECRFCEVNRGFELGTGFSAAQVVGRTPAEVGMIEPAVQDAARAEMRSGADSPMTLTEYRRPDGSMRHVLHTSSLMDVDCEGGPYVFSVAVDVTDYLNDQIRLRERDQRFRALFDNMADGMFFAGPDGQFVEVNDAACKQVGYTRAELLQMSPAQISVRSRAEFAQLMQRLERERQLTYQTLHRHKDGRLVPVQLTLTIVDAPGGPLKAGIARDLTAPKRIEAELREARDRLQAILHALPDLLFEFDEDGVICDFFSSQQDLLGLSPQQFLGKKLSEIARPELSVPVAQAISDAIAKGLSTGTQYTARLPSGMRWFELSAARRAALARDEKARVIAIARDITERKQREEELQLKNDELMRFTYTVSHDLKSPLVTIRSFLGFLLEDLAQADRPRIDSDIAHIQNAVVRMHELLDDLLQLSRIGRRVHAPEYVSLQKLVAESCELVAGRIAQCGAEVSTPERDLYLWGDPVRLRELMQNLIDNAVKFSAAAKGPHVAVSAAKRGDEYVIAVRDNGIGIDPRHQHKLFGLFEKLHPELEGTGIGLALVKRIVEVHQGRVWIESPGPGRGTTVFFTLPNSRREKPL